MASTVPKKMWRNIHTGSTRSDDAPPNPYDWEQVEYDIMKGSIDVVTEAEPRPEPEVVEDDPDEDVAPAAAPIKGYRQLSETELALVNKVKAHAEMTRELIVEMEQAEEASYGPSQANLMIDLRWVSIARTDLQKGFMALVRSITRPKTF